MLAGSNALVTEGPAAGFTISVVGCGLEVVEDEVTSKLWFVRLPGAPVACRVTATAQLDNELREPPVSENLSAPALAVTVPPQVLDAFGSAATSRPVGRMSVKARFVKAKKDALTMLIVAVVVSP